MMIDDDTRQRKLAVTSTRRDGGLFSCVQWSSRYFGNDWCRKTDKVEVMWTASRTGCCLLSTHTKKDKNDIFAAADCEKSAS